MQNALSSLTAFAFLGMACFANLPAEETRSQVLITARLVRDGVQLAAPQALTMAGTEVSIAMQRPVTVETMRIAFGPVLTVTPTVVAGGVGLTGTARLDGDATIPAEQPRVGLMVHQTRNVTHFSVGAGENPADASKPAESRDEWIEIPLRDGWILKLRTEVVAPTQEATPLSETAPGF